METMQDKEIREKLNSLDTLPEGYAPSLDSKWELLMAGQPEKKKRTPYFWYAAAASLLLLLGFGFLFFKTSKTKNEIAVAGTNPPVSGQKTVAFPIEKPETIAANDAPKNAISQTKVTAKNGRPKALKTKFAARSKPTPAPEIVAEATPEKAKSADPIPATEPTLLAVETSKPSRKRKASYVEMDFNEPVNPVIPANVQTAQLSFKIKILPRQPENASGVIPNERPFRLQHTF